MEEKTLPPLLQEARQLLRQLTQVFMDRFNNFAAANMDMALYHFKRNNYSDAALRYRLVLWREPKNVEAWTGLGISLVMAGDTLRGRDALSRAVKLEPGNEKAQAAFAMVSQLPQVAPPSQKP